MNYKKTKDRNSNFRNQKKQNSIKTNKVEVRKQLRSKLMEQKNIIQNRNIIKKTNKIKSQFFKNMNEIDKLMVRLIKNKEEIHKEYQE